MERDARKYLSDMPERATFVREQLSDRTFDELLNDRILRSARERELMVLGEALYQLHRQFPEIAESIALWNEIISFRHILVHGYDALNMRAIWDIIQDDLEPLIKQLDSMLPMS